MSENAFRDMKSIKNSGDLLLGCLSGCCFGDLLKCMFSEEMFNFTFYLLPSHL